MKQRHVHLNLLKVDNSMETFSLVMVIENHAWWDFFKLKPIPNAMVRVWFFDTRMENWPEEYKNDAKRAAREARRWTYDQQLLSVFWINEPKSGKVIRDSVDAAATGIDFMFKALHERDLAWRPNG